MCVLAVGASPCNQAGHETRANFGVKNKFFNSNSGRPIAATPRSQVQRFAPEIQSNWSSASHTLKLLSRRAQQSALE